MGKPPPHQTENVRPHAPALQRPSAASAGLLPADEAPADDGDPPNIQRDSSATAAGWPISVEDGSSSVETVSKGSTSTNLTNLSAGAGTKGAGAGANGFNKDEIHLVAHSLSVSSVAALLWTDRT